MIQVTKDKALQRYDLLTENLKAALFSSSNAEIVRKVGESQHLTEDKIVVIGKIIGYVILGFIHSEDLAQEIKDALNLNSEIANSIAAEIDRKIFALIRADLEKVYQPPTEEILDLRAKVEPPTEVEMPKAEEPKVVPVEEKIQSKPEEIQSKEVQPPEVKPQFGEVEPPKIGVGEAEPLIIHKEAEFKPLAETKKSLGGLFGFLRKGKKEEEKISPVKAQVEIGIDTKLHEIEHEITRKESPTPSPEPPKVRVVHYTEFPMPVSPFGKTKEESEKEKELVEADKRRTTRIIEAEERAKVEEISPPENLPIEAAPEVQPKEVEPMASPVEPPAKSKAEPLDLRKSPEETKPAPEKPLAGPTKPEEEEIIDLSSFK